MTRILIADDREDSRYLLETLLRSAAWDTATAPDGADALAQAQAAPPDLIVSDLLMPVMDGYSLLRAWKGEPRLRHIPFVVYTATYTEPQDEQLALDLGADAFLIKPLEPDRLLTELRQVLARAERGQLAPAAAPAAESTLVRRYNAVLVRKLEQKAAQLQEANRALQADLAQRQRAEAEAARAHAELLRVMEEQRKIAADLRQEQALFESLAAAIPDHIYFKDRASRFIRINASMARRFGLASPAEAVGKTDADFLDPEHARQRFAREQQVMRTGEPLVDIEEEQVLRDGQIGWISTTKVPLRDAQGEITGLVGISRDITERRRADERIRQQATLLDIATDGIMVRDLQHRIQYWNQGCERLYGWTAAEAIGRSSPELLLADRAALDAATTAALRDDAWTGEMRQLNRERQEIVVLSRWSLVRDTRGEPVAVLVINTDITERKKLEAQLFRAQRLESIGQLASGIAHDLNNILTPLTLITPLLRAEITDPETIHLIDMIESNAIRGAEIVKQVLVFSRGVKAGRGPVPLRALLKEVGTMLHETFPKSIKIHVTAPPNLWPVESNPTQIHQVLMNLCVNARDAMPDGGTLSVEAENVNVEGSFASLTPDGKPGAYVALLVADTGTGIPPENLDRIFDPFFTTKEPGQGTGLGLSTVLGIVRAHRAFIRVDSEPGKGTRFRVYLPAMSSAASEPPAHAQGAPRGRGETVLVVDDEDSVRMSTRRILERFGYRVLVASEGGEAIMLFARHAAEIRAVVTDLMMPLMDGAALVRALQKDQTGVKILVVTGAPDTAQASTVRRLGITHFLPKPYSAEELLRGVRALLDGQPLPAVTSAAPFPPPVSAE